MAVVAIVLPAMVELDDLSSQAATSSQQLLESEATYASYTAFYDEISSEDETINERIRQIQLNKEVEGTPIVTDLGSSRTPLQWIDEKVLLVTPVDIAVHDETSLSRLVSGTGRLWIAAFGVFFVFVGCLK